MNDKDLVLKKEIHKRTAEALAPVNGAWVSTGAAARLPEIGQIRIGAQGKPRLKDGKVVGYIPTKLDHFVVYRMERGSQNERIAFKEVHEIIGERPKQIEVMFLFNDPLKNCYQYLGLYQGRKCRCRGNMRIGIDQVDGTERACPCKHYDDDKNSGLCKPNTILHVILPSYPRLGGIFTFRSTSIRTFENFRSQFPFFMAATQGNIAGVPFFLKIQPYHTREFGLTFAVHMEYPESIDKLKTAALERARLRAEWEAQMGALREGSLKLLTAPETDQEEAAVAEEFYPDVAEKSEPVDYTGPKPEGTTVEKPVDGELVDEISNAEAAELEKMWSELDSQIAERDDEEK